MFQHAGRFWMTSVVRDGVGGYSDTLAIHHAAALTGPWREHAQRPVLIDAASARPAGAVVSKDGALWRPVQDCSTGYGKRLGIARINTLGFRRGCAVTVSSGHSTSPASASSCPVFPGRAMDYVGRAIQPSAALVNHTPSSNAATESPTDASR